MAEYLDLPTELQGEVLLTQSPTAIIAHCQINKLTYTKCTDTLFWINYLKGKPKEDAESLLLLAAKENQAFILPLYTAVVKLYGPIDEELQRGLHFISVMRNDDAATKALNLNIAVDLKAVIPYANNLIDALNKGNFSDMENIDLLVSNFYKHLSDDAINDIVVVEFIMDRLKIGILDKLPAFVKPDPLEDEDEDTYIYPGYYDFILTIVGVLAKNGDTGHILTIVEKYELSKDVSMNEFYFKIAEYLPIGLFSYLESQLPARGSNLLNYISGALNIERLNYILENGTVKHQRKLLIYPYLNEIKPHDFVNALINSNLSENIKENIITRLRAKSIGTNARIWFNEVDKLW